jgi:hypothetical protein
MKNVSNPIIIDQHYSASNRGLPCGTTVSSPALLANHRVSEFLLEYFVQKTSAVAVEKIDYIDITGTSATEHAVIFDCSDAMPCKHLSMTGVNLTKIGGGSTLAYCKNAFGRNIGDVVPESCLGDHDDDDNDDDDDDDDNDEDDDDDDDDENDDNDDDHNDASLDS